MRISILTFAAALAAAGCYSPDIASPGYYCHPEDNPACPDGFDCVSGRCVSKTVSSMPFGDGGASLIPKMGAPYSGVHQDRTDLNTASMCPDSDLEPNDGPDKARMVMTAVDMPVAKLIKLAICPKGPNPATGMHDVDYFKVDTTGAGSSTLTVMAEVTYDISYGDLDVGVFDSTGRLLSSDGTAVSNACTTASIGQGVYYVVVAGANNMDINSYELRIRTFSMPKQCTAATPPDMATGGSCQPKNAVCAGDQDCCSMFCSPTLGVCG
jgi:hypothetical protein